MTDKLTWQKFRSLHTGINKDVKSALWNSYKKKEVNTYLELMDEMSLDIPEEVNPYLGLDKPETESVSEPETEPKPNIYIEYAKLLHKLDRFRISMTPKEVRKVENRLSEIAKETRPDNYTCTPTDGWQIWFGPTQQCLLINTSHHLAFICSRSWWQKRYLNAMYVQRELVNEEKQIASLRASYEIRNKLVKRAPLPDVEIMLPTTPAEYTMRG